MASRGRGVTPGSSGGGGEPPRRPPNIKEEPLSVVVEQEEEEDSDRTETVSVSSTRSGIQVIGVDGRQMSLKKYLRKLKRKGRKQRMDKKGKDDDDGGSSPSSSGGSDYGDDSDFEIVGIRGKRGYRGQRGRKGPQGPPGPPIHIPIPPLPNPKNATDTNITLNSSGMEESFRGLSDSLNKIFAQQATLNKTLQGHITMGVEAQDEQAHALRTLAANYRQRDYDRLFNAIPMYNGEDVTACEDWLEKLETACRTGKRDIRDVAITCAEGPVLEVINSVKEDEDWPVLKDEIRRCFSENKTPVHAAALLDDFPPQGPNQNLRAFLYKYTKLHKIASGVQARHDYDLTQKLHFLKRLRNTRIANKIGRSAEFKDYNNFSLAMCFGRALEMEEEFQVGEKCVPSEDPGVLAIQVGQMSDAEICNLTRTAPVPTATPTPAPRKFNPNPCFQCGLPGARSPNLPCSCRLHLYS